MSLSFPGDAGTGLEAPGWTVLGLQEGHEAFGVTVTFSGRHERQVSINMHAVSKHPLAPEWLVWNASQELREAARACLGRW